MRTVIVSILTIFTLPTAVMAQEANPQQDAFDAMAYSSLISFANTLTLGITADAIRENAMSFEDGQLYWRGVAIAPLSESEQKGVNTGQLIGQIAGIVMWIAIIYLFVFLRKRRRQKRGNY